VNRKKEQSAPIVDQTAPIVESQTEKPDLARMPVEISGQTYFLSFEFSALAEAERFFKGQGARFNLLLALPDLGLGSIREVFPCAAHTHHPELTWEAAQALVTMESVYPIATVIQQAWNATSAKNAAPAAV
jgi:hypothetical protein